MERNFLLYGVPFLEGFFVTLFLLATLLFLGRFLRLPLRGDQARKLPRIGGVALAIGFLLVIFSLDTLVFPVSWWTFCGILVLALALGTWDDYQAIPWQYQLLGQGFLVGLLYLGGIHIFSLTNPLGGIWIIPNVSIFSLGFGLFLLWGMLIINALNWIDGSDGLCGSLSFITYAAFFALCLGPVVNQPPLAIVAAVLMGCTLAFLVYNLPRAKLFAGTSGVFFFGFTLFFLSVIAGTKIATALLVLTLPVLDAVFVMFKRLIAGKKLTARDQSHLHHILIEKGWSPTKIVTFYTTLTLLIAIIALQTATLGKFFAIVIVFAMVSILLCYFHFPRVPYRKVVLFGGVIVAAGLCLLATAAWYRAPTRVMVAGTTFTLEVARTPAQQVQGLSNRDSLCATCGMLFEFPESGLREFWMRDMRFSIDVLWLDHNNRVVAKHERVPFPSQIPFGPAVPVKRALELPAGSTERIWIGEYLFFQ
jgi:UDP-GlcNAc:undecaprenyl-phosphate GlcNAc-1-phosphate transferase